MHFRYLEEAELFKTNYFFHNDFWFTPYL